MSDPVIIVGDAEPDQDVPVLWEGPAMDLPASAVLNADGSVTLPLEHPFELAWRAPGAATPTRTEHHDHLRLRRLTGDDMRKASGSKDTVRALLALATGLGPAKWELVSKRLDARDEAAAGDVLSELLGGMRLGLPAHADDTGEAIALPLLFPREDDDGAVHEVWSVRYLTAGQRRAAGEAPDMLVWAVQHASGLNPKLAKSLLDRMDGADVAALQGVIRFLSSSGRRTSG